MHPLLSLGKAARSAKMLRRPFYSLATEKMAASRQGGRGMKIYSITVDAMPKSCGSCPLCGYTNDDFPVCYGVADKQIWRIEGNPCDMQYRRSDCPLIAVGGLG
jgi:hypothetical protein